MARRSDGAVPRCSRLLTSPDEHPQLREEDCEVSGVLADLVRTLAGPTDEIGHLHFVLRDRLLVTARRKSLQGADAARTDLEGGYKVLSPHLLFDHIIACSADGFDDIVERLTRELDRVEDRLLMDAITDERQRLGRVRHTAVRLQRPLSGLRRTMTRLRSRPRLSDGRESSGVILSQRLETIEHDLGTVQDRARLMQDEINAKIAAETNRQLFTLSILTALFVPATLMTGLFGMNVKDLPFTESDSGFWWALATGVAASLAVCFVLWRDGVLRRGPR